jgi:hypothetical protein
VALLGCSATPGQDAVRALPAEASLDARGMGRGAAAERPAVVQVRDTPDRPTILYTVSPRLQSGSAGSPPVIVTSLGAERDRATQALSPQVLVVISNARSYGGFARVESRQSNGIRAQPLSRSRNCADAPSCLFVESLLLTVPEADLRRLAEANAPLRFRLLGNAAFVEAGVPPGHLRALLAALPAS